MVYYDKLFTAVDGRPPINGRVILGAVIIKHLGDLSDRETIAQIQENMFMQYFLGYGSFTNEEPFSDTLFVEIRKRLSLELLSKINEVIALHCLEIQDAKRNGQQQATKPGQDTPPGEETNDRHEKIKEEVPGDNVRNIEEQKQVPADDKPNKGKLLIDATVAPQNITFPTDLKLLNGPEKRVRNS